jgi:hypothetical protein
MKPAEIILRREGENGGGTMKRVNLRYIVSIPINIPMYAPVQLLYANKK